MSSHVRPGSPIPQFVEIVKKDLMLQICLAATQGNYRKIDAIMRNFRGYSPAEILQITHEIGNEQITPLIAAARSGRLRVVRLLLEKYRVDPDQTGLVINERLVFTEVTPLMCAVMAGHLYVARCLLNNGASIDYVNSKHFTALHLAVLYERDNITRYLVAQDADTNVLAGNALSSFMICAQKGKTHLMHCMLDKNADLNLKNQVGFTSLLLAVNHGKPGTVRYLLDAGATAQANLWHTSSILRAAYLSQKDVVEALLEVCSYSRQEAASAMELLGASLALDKNNLSSLSSAFECFRKGMSIRYQDPPVPKPNHPPVPAYGNVRESRTMAELSRKWTDSRALIMECLTVRERILGNGNPLIVFGLIRCSNRLKNRQDFANSLKLLLHAASLNLTRLPDAYFFKGLMTQCQELFLVLVKMSITVTFHEVERSILYAIMEIERSAQFRPDVTARSYLKGNVQSILFMVDMALELARSDAHFHRLEKLVKRLAQQTSAMRSCPSLLHIVMSRVLTLSVFPRKNRDPATPKVSLTDMLLSNGIDGNERDSNEDTALHTLCLNDVSFRDEVTVRRTIRELARAGAHIDAFNRSWRTPLEMATTEAAKEILMEFLPLSLSCLAAGVILKEKVPFEGKLPQIVEKIITLHRAKE